MSTFLLLRIYLPVYFKRAKIEGKFNFDEKQGIGKNSFEDFFSFYWMIREIEIHRRRERSTREVSKRVYGMV